MSTLVVDTLTGKSTATTLTIGATPVVSASANSLTIRGEGSNQTSVQQGLAKAWVRVDQRTSLSTYDSFNISSTSDESPGELTHSLTTNMGNTNYSIAGLCGYADSNDDDQVYAMGLRRNHAPAAGSYTVQTCNALITSDGGADLDNVMSQLFGDLA